MRLFLSQFPFEVVGDDGEHYRLVKRGNFCELDLVGQSTEPVVDDIPARASSEVGNDTTGVIELPIESSQLVTLEVRAERIRHLQADVQRGIIEIGFELLAAKSQVGHGGWADWLQNEFDWTQQTANRFMRVAERFGKLNNVVQFKPSTLQAMLALPAGDEETFIECKQVIRSRINLRGKFKSLSNNGKKLKAKKYLKRLLKNLISLRTSMK